MVGVERDCGWWEIGGGLELRVALRVGYEVRVKDCGNWVV